MISPKISLWRLALVAAALALPAAAEKPAPTCANPQSPRVIDPKAIPSPYDARSRKSIVSHPTAESLVYTPRAGGRPQTLHRCGQHYHFPIENQQGCKGVPAPRLDGKTGKPGPGQWIEVHTVYAAKARTGGCDPETLDCCLEAPFVVRSFEAKVIPLGLIGPIVPPPGRPLAEWSGSTTGREDKPGECKPAAQWSFRLGCGFTVSVGQLSRFHHFDPARPLQTGDRISRDLTLVEPLP